MDWTGQDRESLTGTARGLMRLRFGVKEANTIAPLVSGSFCREKAMVPDHARDSFPRTWMGRKQ